MTTTVAADWPDAARLRAACDSAAAFYERTLRDSVVAHAYMARRGWTALAEPGAEADRWRPGFSPQRAHGLVDHLRSAGFTDRETVDAGLGRRSPWGLVDRFRHRLVFPLVDDRSVIGFVGRALPGSPPDAPKWLNSPTTALYDKGRHLFRLRQNADRWSAGHDPVLVEGAGDAIAISLAGRAAVAPLGTGLTGHHVAALDRTVPPNRPIVVAFDADPAGRRALVHAHHLVRGRPATAATFAEGGDPGVYANTGRIADLRERLDAGRPLAAAVVDVRLDDWTHVLDHPGGQIDAVRDVVDVITSSPDLAGSLVQQIAQRAGLTSGEATRVVVDAMLGDPPPRQSCAGVADLSGFASVAPASRGRSVAR